MAHPQTGVPGVAAARLARADSALATSITGLGTRLTEEEVRLLAAAAAEYATAVRSVIHFHLMRTNI